jgi:von Willebrand factor A domain-containing protein 8
MAHSGDGPFIDMMGGSKYPKNEKDIYTILEKMSSHASFCLSGGTVDLLKDNTIGAVKTAIKEVVKDDADDYFVLVLSDANVHQYNITSKDIVTSIRSDSRVNAYMLFIGNISDQADRLLEGLPGNAFVCLDNSKLPRIIKSMFTSSMLK